MAITTQEARTQILDELAAATDRIALGVACLSEAYELLDVTTADRLEAELFRPLQKASGRARRTYAGFAERVGLGAREIGSPEPGPSRQGTKVLIEHGVAAAAEADHMLAELQDTMLPIEAGDAELRAGLSEVRELLGELPTVARQFLRILGR